jgi:parvulin-like peptidyl-prolyl isomerase
MRFSRILPLLAAALRLAAQTPVAQPPKPPLQATPVAPATPAEGPSITGPEGITMPLQVIAPPVLPPDRVVIQVGDTKLTAGQVEKILEAYPDNQRVYANGPGRNQFIDQVVRILLLSGEGERRKLTETESFKSQLMYAAASILAKLADADIRSKAPGDEAFLKAYYDAHKNEYEQVHAHHILIRAQGSPLPLNPGQQDLSDAEALAKAQEIRQKIVDGGDFAALARAESNDGGSSAKGGDLGFLKRGQIVPSFEDAVFGLRVGELSQPVKTAYGYHIIRVDEKKPTRSFEELRPELEKNLQNEASRKAVADLKAKTKIVIDPEFAETAKPPIAPKEAGPKQ